MVTETHRKAWSMVQSPRPFLQGCLGATAYEKQYQILDAVATSRRVSVVGANGTGKDWAAGRAILWWLSSHYPAKAIATGPTSRQVHDIVWNELRAAYRNARSPIGGRLYDSSRLGFNEQHFAIGFSTDQPFSLQGFHSPNLLVVVTEAHAMKQQDIEALRRLNPRCILMTGNPFAVVGEFYDSHHTLMHLYNTISISAYDTPNLAPDAPETGYSAFPGMVTKEDVKDRADEWGEDSPMYRAGVLGEFPDSLDDTVVPLSVAKEATQRASPAQGPKILAVDVARYGRDRTVAVMRQGDVARIVWRVQGRNTMQIVGWISDYLTREDIRVVVVDDTGVGGGVTDRLKELAPRNTSIKPFNGGSSARNASLYVNAVSEVWWETRKWLMAHGDIDNDNALVGQLSGRAYEYQSDRRIKIESKKKLVRSPDEADALAMTFDPRAVRGAGPLIYV